MVEDQEATEAEKRAEIVRFLMDEVAPRLTPDEFDGMVADLEAVARKEGLSPQAFEGRLMKRIRRAEAAKAGGQGGGEADQV